MKREELAPILRQAYKRGAPCGVEKGDEPGYENLWFVIPPSPPKKISHRLPVAAVSKANQLLGRLARHSDSDQLDQVVAYLFTRQEAIASSRMEGTWSTIDHVLTPGDLYDEVAGKSERASVLGYANALEKEFKQTLEKGTSIFSTDLACLLHKQVVSKDPHYRGSPGQLRTPGKPGSIVLIGGLRRKEDSIYNPTPPRHVRACLDQVMTWMADEEFAQLGDAGMGMSLPVRMAIAHSHFEAVHPFSDGNGRVGRILLTLQMGASGFLPLYLSGFIETQKTDYLLALQEAQKKLLYGSLVEFVAEAIIASQREAELTKASLIALPEAWEARGRFRAQSTANKALSFIIRNPIFTVKQLHSELGVSIPAAARAAGQLVDSKIVKERTGYGRNRVFAAEEVIELLSRRFGDSPKLAVDKAKRLMNV